MRLRSLNGLHDMRLGDKYIFPAVIIVVDELYSPTGVQQGYTREPRGGSRVIEAAVSPIQVEGVTLICQIWNNDVRPAVVVVILEGHAHAGISGAAALQRRPRNLSDPLKGAISFVVKENMLNRV